MAIVLFFLIHAQVSVFMQSFFHHRYSAHRQFSMSKGWERFFHVTAWVVMGSSYLAPRAYAILHRMHHAFCDTPKDPHSPIQEPHFFKMMWKTTVVYQDIKYRRFVPEARFEGGYPEWEILDLRLNNYFVMVAWGTLYALIYLAYVWSNPSSWWVVFLLPFHCFLGPIQGAIVNWGGHKVGYRNFDSDDNSKNTLIFDVLTMGELYQNNHHKFGQSPNFAARWFEIDPAFQIMKVFHALGVIDMSRAQMSRYDAKTKKAKRATPVTAIATPMPSRPSPMDAE